MNIVNSDADVAARQVVPADFSFLSVADRQVVSAMERLVRVMYGIADGVPIWCGKMVLTSAGVLNGVKHWTLSSGVLMLDGVLYEVPQMDCTGSNELIAKSATYIQLTESEASPSPVYGADGRRSVSVHRRAEVVAIMPSDPANLGDRVYKLSSVVTLNEVVRQVVRQIAG